MSNDFAEGPAGLSVEIRQRIISTIARACPQSFSEDRIHLNHRLVEDLGYSSKDFRWLDCEIKENFVPNPRPSTSQGICTVRGVCDWVESNLNPR